MADDGKEEEKGKMDVENDPNEEEEEQDVVLQVSEMQFSYKLALEGGNKEEANKIWKDLLKLYQDNNMIEFYRSLQVSCNLPIDSNLISKWTKAKDNLLAENEKKKEEAEKSEGDVEVRGVELEKGKILRNVSTLEDTMKHYDSIKNLTTGKNIDKHLSLLRLCLAWGDDINYKKYSEIASKLIDKGGDWDRRNRYFVYNGVHYFRIRNFEEAAKGFLDAISTFTANEIFNYKRLVYYTIISSVVSLSRNDIKKKLIESPEIIQIIDTLPVLKSFLHSFYYCRYNEFFRSLIELQKDFIKKDYYLHLHSSYYMRLIRVRAYSQFLQSYQSVKMSTMAKSFGVSEEFLDKELSSFISSPNALISCKIDKVNGIVEIHRTNQRNSQYHEVIKRGDALLSRIQRLSRIVTY